VECSFPNYTYQEGTVYRPRGRWFELCQVIAALRDAGVGSMPGTAAEVLDDSVRRVLCQINTATWLDIVGCTASSRVYHRLQCFQPYYETPEQIAGYCDATAASC